MRKQSASGIHKRDARSSARREPQRLTVPQEYESPLGHWALTDSRPSAGVTLLPRRIADLAAALLDGLFAHPARPFNVVSHRVSVVATGLDMSCSATYSLRASPEITCLPILPIAHERSWRRGCRDTGG